MHQHVVDKETDVFVAVTGAEGEDEAYSVESAEGMVGGEDEAFAGGDILQPLDFEGEVEIIVDAAGELRAFRGGCGPQGGVELVLADDLFEKTGYEAGHRRLAVGQDFAKIDLKHSEYRWSICR